jgi:hypothetical protein
MPSRFVAIALVTCLASSAALAAGVVDEARSVFQELRQSSSQLTQEQERKILSHLRAIRAVIWGGGNPAPIDQPSYTCVSRYNDGRNPFVIGIRDGIQVTRLAGGVFSTEEDCRNALSSSRYVLNETLMCVSRYNDGRNPYQLAKLGTEVTRLPRTLSADVNECGNLLSKLRPTTGGRVLYCNSRYDDNRAPYQVISLGLKDGDAQPGSEVFNTVGECDRFLGTR